MNPDLAELPPLPGAPPHAAGAAGVGAWLLLDPLLRVLGAGPRLPHWLAAGEGPVHVQQGRLQLRRQQAALERAVQGVLAPRATSPLGLVVPREGQPPVTLALYPGSLLPPTVWLHIVWPEQLRLNGPLLGSIFGLTATEQRVALSVAEGRSTRDTAELLGVQENTVRGHIKQLLAKTHTQRQAELAALLWRSAAVVHMERSTPAPQPRGRGAVCTVFIPSWVTTA